MHYLIFLEASKSDLTETDVYRVDIPDVAECRITADILETEKRLKGFEKVKSWIALDHPYSNRRCDYAVTRLQNIARRAPE